jgi:hypothetical protein
LQRIARGLNVRAEGYWEGTRDHDVSQNYTGAQQLPEKVKREACELKAVSAEGKKLSGAAKNSFMQRARVLPAAQADSNPLHDQGVLTPSGHLWRSSSPLAVPPRPCSKKVQGTLEPARDFGLERRGIAAVYAPRVDNRGGALIVARGGWGGQRPIHDQWS